MTNAKLTPVMLKVLRWMAEGKDLEYRPSRYIWMPLYTVAGRTVRTGTADALRVRGLIERADSGSTWGRLARYRLTEAGKAAARG